MIEFSKLKEMTLNEIFKLSEDYKHKAIWLLVNQIAEDRVFEAVSSFETDMEIEKYIKNISMKDF